MSTVNNDRWLAVSPYLDRALDMPEEERTAWLESLRAEDPELASDLAALLEERRAVARENFLQEPPVLRNTPSVSLSGQRFGAYTLLSLVGQGGMGSVWLADRSDGRFEGVAAVKLLNASLVGRAGEERFRREGNILARLAHPNIARLVDAGVSPSGQPYLVLEHVEGEPIDRYCDERNLDVESRLNLFRDVLSAVAHAHANLIVHRDIKPSNVLVGTDGAVKLLDFGIAKLLEEEAATGQVTALTREGGSVLTPEFASPEQVTGGAVTTATDVYALGTLLYLLLTGRHPAEAAFSSPADLFKAIVETEPRRPSDIVVDPKAITVEALIENAARRGTTPEGLHRILKGDLDTIVAKALKKDPVERYRSVTALAEDLSRYLDDKPISARPETLAYRAAKFVRRNRTPVALTAMASLALVLGLVGTITEARRATRHAALAEGERLRADKEARVANVQRDFALRQLSRAEAINDLNAFLLSDAAPSGKPFTVGDLLARAEQVVGKERGESGENRVEILIAIGRQYDAQDQGGKARQVLGRAYELAKNLPERTLRAKAACALGSAVVLAGETERAESLIREGLDDLPNEPQFALDRVFCLLRGSEVARDGGDVQAGVERVEAAQRLLKESHLASAHYELSVWMDLAESNRMAGRYREAVAAFSETFKRLSALGRDETETARTVLNNWALVIDVHRPLEAERLFRRAVRINSADSTERGVSPMLLNNLARVLADLHRLPEAADYADRAYTKAREAGAETAVNQSLLVRASVYRQLGDLGRAATLLSEVEQRYRRMLPGGHPAFGGLASSQALLAQARGDFPAAKAAADRAVAIAGASTPEFLPLVLQRRSNLELQMHFLEEARADAVRALGMWQQTLEEGTFSSAVGRCYLALGRALQGQGKLGEARAAFASALEHLQPTLGADHPETQDARNLASTTVEPTPRLSVTSK